MAWSERRCSPLPLFFFFGPCCSLRSLFFFLFLSFLFQVRRQQISKICQGEGSCFALGAEFLNKRKGGRKGEKEKGKIPPLDTSKMKRRRHRRHERSPPATIAAVERRRRRKREKINVSLPEARCIRASPIYRYLRADDTHAASAVGLGLRHTNACLYCWDRRTLVLLAFVLPYNTAVQYICDALPHLAGLVNASFSSIYSAC